MVKRNSVAKRLARVERELKQDKPEVKTLDTLLNPLTSTGFQNVMAQGIMTTAGVFENYDLTRGFLQGLENTGGNIDGNYCKLTSMDLRIYLNNTGGPPPARPVSTLRVMIVRVPNADLLTPAEIQAQVLEYGDYVQFGQLANVSPLKRNSTINGGYDVMYDRVHTLCNAIDNPLKSTKYIHFKKKWAKGLTLRFSGFGGTAGSLSLEQNRIYLFAMDVGNVWSATNVNGTHISFINRLRFSDE